MEIYKINQDKPFCEFESTVGFWLSILFIFLCFFLAEYLTPMHSDDFSYGQMGLDFSKHFRHYMSWSGRLVADYSSCLILSIPNHTIVSGIIAGIATTMCFFISTIPSVALHGVTEKSSWKFLCIAVLYWVSNPNLGQTTFWVVGACNYLVTTFFISLFLYIFALHVRDETINTFQAFLIFVLSMIAGCTNENMGITLVYMVCACYLILKIQKTKINNYLFALVLAGLIIGSLVLLLAPGNYVRMSSSEFDYWRNTSILKKIFIHLTYRGSLLIYYIKEALIFYLVVLVSNSYFFKKINSKERVLLSLVCFSGFIFSFLVMVAAPYLNPRACNGIFFFLLLAISFLLHESMFREKIAEKIFCVLSIVFGGLFLKSFLLVICSYKTGLIQADMRNSHINYEKLTRGNEITVTVPGYCLKNFRKSRDMFDPYHSPAQASYCGVKRIDKKDVSYDYSILRTGRKLKLINETDIDDAQMYIKPSSLFYKNGTLLLECSKKPNDKMHVQYYDASNLKNIELKDCIKLQEKYYLGATVKSLKDVGCVRLVYAKTNG